jgi:ribosomal protein L14E/L6E/L27E
MSIFDAGRVVSVLKSKGRFSGKVGNKVLEIIDLNFKVSVESPQNYACRVASKDLDPRKQEPWQVLPHLQAIREYFQEKLI